MAKWYKLISSIIAALLLISNISIAFAQTSDYSKNWANKEIEKWLSYGVIQTNDKGDFKPSDPIKRIDMAIVLNKLFNYQEKSNVKFSDIAAGSPYAADVAKAVAAGNFAGNNGKFRPNDSITRQEAAVVFARAFSLTATTKNAIAKFKDAAKIATWSKDAINIMVNNGYMSGIPGNLFAPGASITRAEAVKIVDNLVMDLKNKAGTYTGDVNGNMVVNTKDVMLENMTIKGDLYLSEGIGNGEVKLNNVKISGRTVVKGGGENSVVLNNTSISGSLVILKRDGKVRVVASGNSEITDIILSSGARLEESNLTGKGFGDVDIIQLAPGQQVTLDGDFDSLDIEADGVKANIPDGSVGTVKIKEGTNGSKLEIGSTASVKNLVANDDVAVTGGSRIENADINSNGVVIDTKPENIEIAPNVTATVAGTSTTGSPTTTTSPAAVIPPVVPPVAPPAGGGGGGGGEGTITTPTMTQPGYISIKPETATISTKKNIDICYTPNVRTKDHTVVFNLPDEIPASTKDSFYMASDVEFELSNQNISNSGKTVTIKGLDLRTTTCAIRLNNKIMPATTGALAFSVSDDSDGDLSNMSPGTTTSASMDIVSTVSDLHCYGLYNSFLAEWTRPVGASSVVLKYRPVSGAWKEVPCPIIYSSNAINGITPDTAYEVKLLVTGGINAGESNTVTVHLGGGKYPPLLEEDLANNILGNDIILSFTDDLAWRNSISGIEVMNRSQKTTKYYSAKDENPKLKIQPGSIILDKSIIAGEGFYSVYVDAIGYMEATEHMQFGPVTDLSCVFSTDTEAFFQIPEIKGATSAKIQQSINNGNDWVDSDLEYPGSSVSMAVTVVNLSRGTNYLFRLVVSGGRSAGVSNIVKVTTYNIKDFSITASNNSSATFRFTAPGEGMTSATIQIQSAFEDTWKEASGQTPITSNTTSASINGLSPNMSYTARLLISGGTNAGYSNLIFFATQGNIQDLSAKLITDQSVTLQFSPLGEDVTSAFVEYYSDINSKMYYEIPSASATTTNASITGLTPNTNYTFSLLVYGVTNSGFSNSVGLKTLSTIPITLSVSDRTVIVGEVDASGLTVISNNYVALFDLSYSSNNTSVATVNTNSGIITGVSAGTAVITATASWPGYQSVTATFTVTVVEDTAPTIKASVDNRNNITLAFSNAVYKAGIMRVYTENGTTQLGNSIDLAPAAGMAVWESPTVARIVNTAGSTGLDNTDAKVIKIKISGVKEAVGSEITLAEKIITLQAMDTNVPRVAAYYLAKSGSTAANDTITFYFSEAMNANTLKDLNNYVVTSTAGVYYENKALSDYKDDVSISSVASDSKSVVIKINNGMAAANAGLAFQVHSMEDMAGNKIAATDVTRYIEVKPYVTTTRAIAVNKVEIEFNQEIAVCAPGTFILRTGPSSTSPVAAVFISTLIDGKKVTATLDRNLTTDFTNAYLDVLNNSLTKNMYGIELSTAAGIYTDAPVSLLANGPVAVPDKVKAVVKAFSATTGGIIIEFSELMTTVATDFLIEMSLFKDTDPVNVEATSISAINGGNLATGFTKLLISGLEADKEYCIQLNPKGVTRDKSEYCNMFVQSDRVTITPK